ncbi:hypothetical protein Q9L58_009069 [Maublancomyces gigas]|uniref:Uncharacterized protein n=1 Tax=Discina gigas TaxID=1032678 RepID=A0ABR3G7Y1_9PEZI
MESSQNILPSAAGDGRITCFIALKMFSELKVLSDFTKLGSTWSAVNIIARFQTAFQHVDILMETGEALSPETRTAIIFSFNSLLHLIDEKDWRSEADDDDTEWDSDDDTVGDSDDVTGGNSDDAKEREFMGGHMHAVTCLRIFIWSSQGYQGPLTDLVDKDIITRFRDLLRLVDRVKAIDDETMAQAVIGLNQFLQQEVEIVSAVTFGKGGRCCTRAHR